MLDLLKELSWNIVRALPWLSTHLWTRDSAALELARAPSLPLRCCMLIMASWAPTNSAAGQKLSALNNGRIALPL